MKLAIMQPYVFPYIGYFQMVNAVDKFVFYDDVNFIKKGWINRNRILVNEQDYTFTIPLQKASQNNLIKDSYINLNTYTEWKTKFYQTLEHNYKKSPNYNAITALIQSILENKKETISELSIASIKQIADYLNIETSFVLSSENYHNQGMEKEERLIDICKKEGATQYINAIGGQELYKKENFDIHGIQLNFIKPLPIEYKQFNNDFVPWLSIIDVLMFNSIDEVKLMLDKYELV